MDEAVRAAYVSVLSRAFTLAAETFTLGETLEGPPGESLGLERRGEEGLGDGLEEGREEGREEGLEEGRGERRGEGRGEGRGVPLGVTQPGGESRTTLIPLLDSLQVRTRARVTTRA